MGRNKDLRKRIASWRKVVERHEEKIRVERMKLQPNEASIRVWQREIETARKKVAQLSRRLKREW